MREQPKQQIAERRLTKKIRFEIDKEESIDLVKGTIINLKEIKHVNKNG